MKTNIYEYSIIRGYIRKLTTTRPFRSGRILAYACNYTIIHLRFVFSDDKPESQRPYGVIYILRNHQGEGISEWLRRAYIIFALSNAEFDYGRGKGV